MIIFNNKKREIHLSFTLTEGFAIPVPSRKTTEIHARYVQPARPTSERGNNYISTRTFIVAVWTWYEILRRFQLVANNVLINAFFNMSPLFYAVGASGLHFILRKREGYTVVPIS